MGTVDTRDRRALVLPELDVDDCGFRMLEPHEIKVAMAFPADYVILGNKREQTRQCGNALTPPASDLLTQRAVASLR
jgi:DNA (cytosine-5)-methyltransferase 1